MRDLITIGELAELLHTSTSKIRFYEKMGLVKPRRHDENGYRLYDFKEIETLQFINLLRELDVPIDELKKISESETKYDYKRLLMNSSKKIKDQINRLANIQETIDKKLRGLEEFENSEITLTTYSKRIIYLPFKEAEDISETPKEIYDFVSKNNIDYTDANHDIYNILTPEGKRIYGIHNKNHPDSFKIFQRMVLPAGKYLSSLFPISTKVDAKRSFEKLTKKASEQGLTPTGFKIIVEFFETLAYSVDDYIMRFEISVAEKS